MHSDIFASYVTFSNYSFGLTFAEYKVWQWNEMIKKLTNFWIWQINCCAQPTLDNILLCTEKPARNDNYIFPLWWYWPILSHLTNRGWKFLLTKIFFVNNLFFWGRCEHTSKEKYFFFFLRCNLFFLDFDLLYSNWGRSCRRSQSNSTRLVNFTSGYYYSRLRLIEPPWHRL